MTKKTARRSTDSEMPSATYKLACHETGSALDILKPHEGITFDHPLTFLVGPNGTGKSSLLRSIQNSLGVSGWGLGEARRGLPEFQSYYFSEPKITDYLPSSDDFNFDDSILGYADLRALNWQGEAVWLHDSRFVHDTTAMMCARNNSNVDRALAIVDGRSSHGETRAAGLRMMLSWAAGKLEGLKDPLDRRADRTKDKAGWRRDRVEPGDIAAAWLEDKPRSAKKWLLIDEPENGLDTKSLLSFFSALAALAETPDSPVSRVIVSTHSPYAVTMADAGRAGLTPIGDPHWAETMRNATAMDGAAELAAWASYKTTEEISDAERDKVRRRRR